MSRQNVTLHLYFTHHNKLEFYFLKRSCGFYRNKSVSDTKKRKKKKKYVYVMKYSFKECESGK